MKYRIRSKWVVTFAAIMVQMAIGALYTWSLFNKPIAEAYSANIEVVAFIYATSLVAFAVSTIFSGKIQQKKGPRFTALIGGLLYTGGILLSSVTHNWIGYFITYGVMAGAGVGFVYVCPLSTLVKWFPNHKGLFTGIATGAFALGAFIFKQVIGGMFDIGDAVYTVSMVSNVFLTVGIIYGFMTIGGALLLDVPEVPLPVSPTCKPQNWDHTRSQMKKTKNFWKLLFSDLLALMPGLLIIGLAKDIGREYAGLDYAQAAGIVGIIALVNAAGRLLSGFIADKLGALRVYRFMYLLTIVCLAVLAFVPLNGFTFVVAILGIAIGYGSFLSLVPTIVGRLFGGKYFSENYPLVFQAYGIAALLGIFINKVSSGFNQAFTIAMITAIIGLIVALRIKDINEDEIEVVCE